MQIAGLQGSQDPRGEVGGKSMTVNWGGGGGADVLILDLKFQVCEIFGV